MLLNDFDKRMCGTCVYCRRGPGLTKLGDYACFRWPPSAFPVRNGLMSVRAPVNDVTPACGEYQPRLSIGDNHEHDAD